MNHVCVRLSRFLPSSQECVLGHVPADSARRYAPIKEKRNSYEEFKYNATSYIYRIYEYIHGVPLITINFSFCSETKISGCLSERVYRSKRVF